MAVHSSGTNGRSGAEFDQLYFDTSSTSPLSKTAAVMFAVNQMQPTLYRLYQNYPNPFNPTTKIRFDLSGDAQVNLTVYDVLGREVVQLINDERQSGVHDVLFDGTHLASGVYYYRLMVTPLDGNEGTYVDTKKLMLTK